MENILRNQMTEPIRITNFVPPLDIKCRQKEAPFNLRFLAVKMVRLLGVASLLFSSYIALAAAEGTPRLQANDVVARLVGRTLNCSGGMIFNSADSQPAHLMYSSCVQ